MTVRFGILGELRVEAAERTVRLGPPKQRLLLAVLLCQLDRPVSVPSLVDALWECRPPASAVENVRSYVHRLRRLLGAGVELRGGNGGYGLIVDPASVDAHRFTDLARRGESALARDDPTVARSLLRQALALWRGRPFAGLEPAAVLATESTRLEEHRLSVAELWVDAELRLGGGAELVSDLRSMVAVHPYRERYWCQLMTALHRSARRADAIAAYHQARTVLAEDLGIDPGVELTALYLSILRDEPPPTAGASGRFVTRGPERRRPTCCPPRRPARWPRGPQARRRA